MKIKIGSRASKLAVVQTEYVINSLKKYHPNIEFELVTMSTTGDKILDKTLDKIGGKGLFIKELEEALLAEKVDITVHSMKDMPMELREDLPILALSKRENPLDVLVLPQGISELNLEKPIGTSSLRRSVQVKELYPNSTVKPIRGNVITRLEKLDRGEFSTLILAYAGLKRLGLEQRISRIFTPEEMLPAGCQGVLAVQGRANLDPYFLAEFHQKEVEQISNAERAFLKELGGGCSSPVACYGTILGETLELTGMNVISDTKIRKNSISGSIEQGELLGFQLAEQLKKES